MSDRPGRNSPCPCGSGKKFKKCCGFDNPSVEDELFAPIPEEMRTGTKLDAYYEAIRGVLLYTETLKSSSKFGSDLRRVWNDYERKYKPGTDKGLPDSFLMNWFALDNRFGVDQRTAVERMMEEEIFKGLSSEVQSVLRELSDSYATCHQVKELKKECIVFEELVTGRRWTVRRIGDPYEDEVVPGVIWHARFVGPDTDACYFGQPITFGPEVASDFTKIVGGQIASFEKYTSTRSLKFVIPRDAFKAAMGFWSEYLYRSASGEVDDPDDEEVDERLVRTVVTTDGEKMRMSSVLFKIIQSDGLRDKLSRMQGLEYDKEGSCWAWLKKGNRSMKSWENTLLGRVFIRGDELVGEVNSLERVLRLKNKLFIGLGKLVEFDRIDSKDLAAMPPPSEEDLRKFEESQRRIHADPQVRKALLQKLEEYYLKDWISSKIPALNNKTPLQALKTKEGRLELEALINQMDGMNAARPDYIPKFDMNLLRQKLGLPLLDRS